MLMVLMMLLLLWGCLAAEWRCLAADAHDADDAWVLVVVKQWDLAADAHDADDVRVPVAVKTRGPRSQCS